MAKICSWCGKKLPFLDIAFDLIEIDGEEYNICGNCNSQINAYKGGDVRLKDIALPETDKTLIHYMEQFSPDEEIIENNEREHARKEFQKQQKKQAQEINPLYEDIHQIAGDLRFIKNLIIIGIVIAVISALITFFQMI